MQVVTNQGFVKTRGRLGRVASLLGFAILIGGLILSFQNNELIFISYVALVPGYMLIMYGNYATLRWGIKPRIDEILATALKSLDHRHFLYNYQSSLPAENLLLTPSGLFVLEVRPYVGEFSVDSKGRWHRKRGLAGWLLILGEGALGNPVRDGERKIKIVREFLSDQLGPEAADSVPIESVAVFTHPRAKLTVENPDVQAALARDLRGQIKRPRDGSRMTNDVYRQVARLLRTSTS